MIQVKKSYVVELQEDQARQLYNLLQSVKQQDQFSYGGLYDDLRKLYNELNGGSLYGKIKIVKLPKDKDVCDLKGQINDYFYKMKY